MAVDSLVQLYKTLQNPLSKIFVVPLIRYSQPNTSYLYNLYWHLLESPEANLKSPSVRSLSVFAHYRFVWEQLLSRSIIVHYHWLEFQDYKAAAGMVWKWTCLQIFFLLGGKLIWTIHNKEPHRGRWLRINYLLRRWMAQRAEQLHVHCQSVIPELSDYFDVPAEKFFVHPHPRFPAQYIPRRESINRLNQTYRLNISPDNQIFLIFGNIARYKRIGKVVDIFSRLSNKNELIIAGKVKKGNQKLFKRLNRKVKENKNIKIIGRFIPDERVPYFLNSADYLIFNHYKLIASGAIELAFSYDKPVLAPRKGCLKEQFNHPKVHLFESQEELENLMQKLAGIQS